MADLLILLGYGTDNVDKATIAFNMGICSLSSGDADVRVILMSEGVVLGAKDRVDDNLKTHDPFKPLKHYIDTFVQKGGKLFLCGTCADARGITEYRQGAAKISGPEVVKTLKESKHCMQWL